MCDLFVCFFFFKQKKANEVGAGGWSLDVWSSALTKRVCKKAKKKKTKNPNLLKKRKKKKCHFLCDVSPPPPPPPPPSSATYA